MVFALVLKFILCGLELDLILCLARSIFAIVCFIGIRKRFSTHSTHYDLLFFVPTIALYSSGHKLVYFCKFLNYCPFLCVLLIWFKHVNQLQCYVDSFQKGSEFHVPQDQCLLGHDITSPQLKLSGPPHHMTRNMLNPTPGIIPETENVMMDTWNPYLTFMMNPTGLWGVPLLLSKTKWTKLHLSL